MNGTLQDRLDFGELSRAGKELRLRGVGDLASANALLDGGFLDGLNGKFAVTAKRGRTDLHRKVAAATKLDEVLCVREERAVGRDWCMQWRGRVLQVDERHAPLDLPRPDRRVWVIEKLDGTLLLRYGKEELAWREVSRRPPKPKPPRKPAVNNRWWRPPAGHPFRRALKPGPGPRGERTDSSIASRTPDIPIAIEQPKNCK